VNQAIDAAVEANKAVEAENIPLTGNERFRICIGIGYGEVLRTKNSGVCGDEMNLASKLGEDIAKASEILLTESAYSNRENETSQFEKRSMQISGVNIPYYALHD